MPKIRLVLYPGKELKDLNKNQKEILTIEIEDFDTWNATQKKIASKKPVSNNSQNSFNAKPPSDDTDFDFLEE